MAAGRMRLDLVYPLDIRIMNLKIQLKKKLLVWGVDFDHYKANRWHNNIATLQETVAAAAGVRVEVGPCDFPDFYLVLLTEYTASRCECGGGIPQFYNVKTRESDNFRRYYASIFRKTLDEDMSAELYLSNWQLFKGA